MNYSQEEKVLIFIVGVCDHLQKNKVARGTEAPISAKGLGVFDQLEAEGFRPTEEETRLGVKALRTDANYDMTDETAGAILLAVMNWDMLKEGIRNMQEQAQEGL